VTHTTSAIINTMNSPLFIVDTGQVAVDDRMVGAQIQCSQVGRYSPVRPHTDTDTGTCMSDETMSGKQRIIYCNINQRFDSDSIIRSHTHTQTRPYSRTTSAN